MSSDTCSTITARTTKNDEDMSNAEVMAGYADNGFSIKRVKAYAEDADVQPGVVSWRDVEAML